MLERTALVAPRLHLVALVVVGAWSGVARNDCSRTSFAIANDNPQIRELRATRRFSFRAKTQ
jgi:hypothetical protein